MIAQRISMVDGVAQVHGLRLAEVRRAHPGGPARAGRRAASASTRSQRAVTAHNVNLPTGMLYGPHQALTVQANGQLINAAALPAADRGLSQRRAGAPGRLGTCIDSVENDQDGGLVQRPAAPSVLAIQRQPGTNTVEVADAVKALLPQFRAQLPAVRQHRTSSTTARVSIRNSVPGRQVHADADAGAGGAGDLPVPAQRLGDASSRAWRCRCRSSARSR